MKKNLSLVMVMVICLFAGLIVSKAATPKIKLVEKFDCTTPMSKDGKKYTTCTINVTAEEGGTFAEGATQTLLITYDEPTDSSDFEIVDTIGTLGGSADTIQKKGKEGGSFVYHFSSKVTLETGKQYTIAKIKFTAEDKADLDCGGTVEFGGSSSGNKTEKTVTDVPKTGVSIPVAIIGIGAVAGLAIYSVSTRKTKMHRI